MFSSQPILQYFLNNETASMNFERIVLYNAWEGELNSELAH